MVRLVNEKGLPIRCLDDWTKPKREHQWQDSYSAMELAKAWCNSTEPTCPAELRALLDSHPLTRGAVLMDGAPEHVTALPVRGEGRNHDLWLLGEIAGSKLTVCVEAKVEEPFGRRIGTYVQKSRQGNGRSGVPARARELLRVVLGRDADPEQDPIASLRYQLLTAIAGSVLQAQSDGAQVALLVVHEFRRQRPKNPLTYKRMRRTLTRS